MRAIVVKRHSLIDKIKENRETHIKEYKEAVEAFKIEALKQLSELTNKVNEGDLKIKLNLVYPVNNTKHYDDLISMFEWDLTNEVTLTRDEFNSYILDEHSTSLQAKLLNSSYR